MRLAALALVALLACSRDGLPGGGDLGGHDLATTGDLAAGGFCADPRSPRIDLNGMLAASPAVTARPLILNCCDGAAVEFVSMQIATSISLGWLHQVGQGPDPPIALDLAHLPAGWSVFVSSGCTPGEPNCQPSDMYANGITGALTIGGDRGGWTISACAAVAEDQASPHPVIHTLELWTPPVTAM